MSRLESLDMKDNALTGALPEELGYLTTLQYVALSSNRFEGKIPSTLGGVDHLGKLVSMQRLLASYRDALIMVC